MQNNEITCGNFYFIENQYFIDVSELNSNSTLMSNKETINGQEHNRPCFYSFKDNNNGIYWLIPISSQVDKFQAIYNEKIKKYKEVDTIVFGFVMGNKKAFLIQNMFPATSDYIRNVYIDSVTNQPVMINDKLKNILNKKAKKVLFLQRKGFKLIFPNVLKIEEFLLSKQILNEVAITTEE